MKKILVYTFFIIPFAGCKKDWLDAKPDNSLVVPTTISDLQGLLDNTYSAFNYGGNTSYPSLGEISADNYYLSFNVWQALALSTWRNAYTWAPEIFEGAEAEDWSNSYLRVFYSNVVLEGLKNIERNSANSLVWDNIKGSALFCRAFDFYNLSQQFAKTYSKATSQTDLGIPLKLKAEINESVSRATVQQTYAQIIADLLAAKELLPITPAYKTRPSRPAAFAMLAKTYLVMEDYDKALQYTDSCLQLFNTLIDYSKLNAAAAYPIERLNIETIYYCRFKNETIFRAGTLIIDSTLYTSYHVNDLRRSVFFTTNAGNITFKGSYDGTAFLFSGIASDEILLIRAECYARTGNTALAMQDLNTLMEKRWKPTEFTRFTADNAEEALVKILVERRKELLLRGIRWSDLRRLNKEPRFAVTLKRVLNGVSYTLMPGDKRYVLPIPDSEIRLSGIEQNPR